MKQVRNAYGIVEIMQPDKVYDFVLLRGLGRHSSHWAEFPFLLQQAFPDSVIHLVDLPGAGKLAKTPAPLKIDDFVPYLEKQLPKQITNPVIAIGVSLGGMVAVAWSSQHRSRFERLFMLNSSAANLSKLPDRLKPPAVYHMLRSAFSLRSHAKETWILSLVSNTPHRRADLVGHWAQLHRESPVTGSNILRQLLAAATFHAPNELNVKGVHILTSKDDRLCDVRCSEALAKHLSATLEVHETAGHDLVIDDPMWVIEKIKATLKN